MHAATAAALPLEGRAEDGEGLRPQNMDSLGDFWASVSGLGLKSFAGVRVAFEGCRGVALAMNSVGVGG